MRRFKFLEDLNNNPKRELALAVLCSICSYCVPIDGVFRIPQRDIATLFKPSNKVTDLIRPVKDTLPLVTPRVYKITMQLWFIKYWRLCNRLVSTKLKEHMTRIIRECEVSSGRTFFTYKAWYFI